jgi:hypothetical protein
MFMFYVARGQAFCKSQGIANPSRMLDMIVP